MTRVLALADQSKIGSTPQRRFATAGTETLHNGVPLWTETACRFQPKSPVGNSEICIPDSASPSAASPRSCARHFIGRRLLQIGQDNPRSFDAAGRLGPGPRNL